MTNKIELTDEELKRLLKVLDANVAAVDMSNTIRWTNAAASRIDRVKQTIEQQHEQ